MGAYGNGNLFGDLGFDGADEHREKADKASRIASIVEESGMSNRDIARVTGMSEIDVMGLLRGRFRDADLDTMKRVYAALAG